MVDMEIGCPFCHPLERILLQNDTAQALLSDPRKAPGHIVVTPKRHIEKPWLLDGQELADIFSLIFRIEQKLIPALGTGCDIRQAYRPFTKQDKLKVNHLTFHIIPRYRDDYLYSVSEKFEEDVYAELDDDERAAVIALIEQ